MENLSGEMGVLGVLSWFRHSCGRLESAVVIATPAPHTPPPTHRQLQHTSQEQSHMWTLVPHVVDPRVTHKGSCMVFGRDYRGWGEDSPMLGRMWSRLKRAFRNG